MKNGIWCMEYVVYPGAHSASTTAHSDDMYRYLPQQQLSALWPAPTSPINTTSSLDGNVCRASHVRILNFAPSTLHRRSRRIVSILCNKNGRNTVVGLRQRPGSAVTLSRGPLHLSSEGRVHAAHAAAIVDTTAPTR